MKILLVEDNERVADFVAKGLHESGHVVDRAANGRDGLFLASSETYDAIVLDRMLAEVDDRIKGLRAGGDDYLTKPFAFGELIARLEALMRRSQQADTQTTLTVGDLKMDLLARQVTRAGKPIELQPREFKLLEYLMRHAEQAVTRTMLLENVWDYHFDPQTNVIDAHVSKLRQKIDAPFDRPLLQTIRGVGYRLGARG
jgi:two-component system OmpR family response regulator